MAQYILPNAFSINTTVPLTRWYRLPGAANKILQRLVWHPLPQKKEIKLTNVARASLEELMIDYEDFLRTNKWTKWNRNDKLYLRFTELNKTENANYQTYIRAIENEAPAICANAMICLTNIVIYLLKQQIKTLEQAFVQEGGLRERMTKARMDYRNSGKR